MKFRWQQRIASRLAIGFGVVAALTALLGMIALIQLDSLANMTKEMYNHTITVSRAIGKIRTQTVAIHQSMHDYVLAETEAERQAAIQAAAEHEREALKAFEVVREGFAGDPALVEQIYRQLIDWQTLRQEEIDLARQGRIDEAAEVAGMLGAEQVMQIQMSLQALHDFASSKADAFFRHAEQARQRHLLLLSGLILLVFALCLGGGYRITRSITEPLGQVMATIGEIRRGSLDRRIGLTRPDEIGKLARAFDEMTANLQATMVSRDELGAANQQLDAANQQLRAANQQIQASEQQLRASNQQLQAANQQLRAANEQLEAQESQLKGLGHILETSLNEIYIFDAETMKFVQVNEGARRNSGYTMEELSKMTPLDIKPEFTARSFELLTEPLRTGEQAIMELQTRHRRKDGSLYPVDIHLQMSTLSGRAVYVAIIMDITDRRRAEQERERLMRLLEGKNQELQDIIYVASHDLKTPLVTINGFSDMLIAHCRRLGELLDEAALPVEARGPADLLLEQEIPEDIAFITAGARKMKTLLDGLLKISRIGASTVRPERIDMNELIRTNLNAAAYPIQQKGAVVEVADGLPDGLGDADQISQVFSNLLDNALKYAHPSRPPRIRISGRRENGQCIYCIEDNGIGIRPDYFEKVFEIFHRLNPKDTVEGEGLGLTIVRRILDLHNGKVWIESKPEEGSKFLFSLPC